MLGHRSIAPSTILWSRVLLKEYYKCVMPGAATTKKPSYWLLILVELVTLAPASYPAHLASVQ